ncbi:hypothetical protein [Priestia koreensis]|uniref:hypothetical protein n=1 Tax=Priestia koreensis TaxID=284581 RepID=UPI0030190A19
MAVGLVNFIVCGDGASFMFGSAGITSMSYHPALRMSVCPFWLGGEVILVLLGLLVLAITLRCGWVCVLFGIRGDFI